MSRQAIKSGKYSCFKNMADAGPFIRNLNAAPPSEIKPFLLLQMFLPSSPRELLDARWRDFSSQYGQWVIKPGTMNQTNDRIISPQVAFLSSVVINILDDLHKYSGHGDLLFPGLFAMKKTERDKEFSQALQSIWPHYPIE